MSEWEGFLTESKKYKEYPKCGRIHFWMRFPIAFLIYTYFELRGWIFK